MLGQFYSPSASYIAKAVIFVYDKLYSIATVKKRIKYNLNRKVLISLCRAAKYHSVQRTEYNFVYRFST